MINLRFIQVYQQLVELSKKGELRWTVHKGSEFPYLDADSVLSSVYKARFKNKDMIIYQQRVSLNRSIIRSEAVCDFVDDNNQKIGEMPRAKGINDLYRQAFLQNRDPRAAELDKVVAVLTKSTRFSALTWQTVEPQTVPELYPEVLTSKVFLTEYRGKNFLSFRELLAGGDRDPEHIEDKASLWVVDGAKKKVRDLYDAEGIEQLHQTIVEAHAKIEARPKLEKLDAVVDQLVAASISQIVTAFKAEKERQAAKAAAERAAQQAAEEAARAEALRLEHLLRPSSAEEVPMSASVAEELNEEHDKARGAGQDTGQSNGNYGVASHSNGNQLE